MFELYTGASYLFQWDKDQKFIVHDDRIDQVIFSDSFTPNAIVRDCYTLNGVKVVDIPNVLLETNGRLSAYAYVIDEKGEYTLKQEMWNIVEKKKPDDYVEDEEELYRWTALDKRITELEKGNVDIDLSDYYTKEEADNKFITEHQDLSSYALKSDIPTDYAPKEHTHSQYLTQHQDLSSYAKKSELPTKTSQLTNDSGYLTSVPSEYVTETELNAKGYLTQHQSLANYYTKTETYSKSEVDTKTDELSREIANKSDFSGDYNDLTNKPTIPSIDGLASETYVDDKVTDLSQDIEDLKSTINGETKTEMLSEVGYQENMRINSSGGIVATNGSGSDATNHIPCKVGDVIVIENMTLPTTYTGSTYWNIVAGYDSSKSHIKQTFLSLDAESVGGYQVDAKSDGTNITQFTVKESFFGSNVAYIAISAKDITSESKVYVVSKAEETENDDIPPYWLEELETKSNDIQVAMENAGRNKSAFLWYTDLHWLNNSKMSPRLLKYLIDNTSMNKVNCGGDVVCDPSPYNHDNVNYVYEWRKRIANLQNHHSVLGNHDLNHWTNDVHNMAYALVLAHEESSNMVVGGDSYYYIDNPSEKTRYLYLAYLTSDHDEMTAQGQFIVEAIKGVSDGWHIVVIAHRWFQYTSSSNPTSGSVPTYETEILQIFDEYNARGTHTTSNYFTSQDFSSGKGKVEFCIGGHIHVDYDFTSNGGIPIIITASDTNQERSSSEEEDCGTLGTITESAVYGIIADYSEETTKITVVGVGRGTSRVVSVEATPTNLFDKNDSDVAIGSRINSSGAVPYAQDGQLVTGWIEAKVGDVFTIQSDKDNKTTNYTGMCGTYKGDKSFISQIINYDEDIWTWSDDNLIGTITIPSVQNSSTDLTSIGYVRFCVAYNNIDSIVITKN